MAFAHVSEQKTEGLKREGGLIVHVSEQKPEGLKGNVESLLRGVGFVSHFYKVSYRQKI